MMRKKGSDLVADELFLTADHICSPTGRGRPDLRCGHIFGQYNGKLYIVTAILPCPRPEGTGLLRQDSKPSSAYTGAAISMRHFSLQTTHRPSAYSKRNLRKPLPFPRREYSTPGLKLHNEDKTRTWPFPKEGLGGRRAPTSSSETQAPAEKYRIQNGWHEEYVSVAAWRHEPKGKKGLKK